MISETSRVQVLVVEDEWLIADLIGFMLEDAGYEIIGPAGSVREAQALIELQMPGLALLDVNLGDERSYAIADTLGARGVPYILMTGYNSADLPERYQSGVILNKPVLQEELVQAVRGMLA